LAHSLAPDVDDDPDFVRVIEAWPTLAAPVRAGILAMIDASTAAAVNAMGKTG
jgi:hypothetical protein